MGEPEAEPGAPPGTLAPQCENEINPVTDAPLSPITTSEVAVSETVLEDKGNVTLAGEASAVSEFTLEEEAAAMAADDNPSVSVKEEVAEVQEDPKLEVDSYQPEAVIAGTEEGAVKREEGDDDDQTKLSMNEEEGPAAKTSDVGEVMISGSDDTVPKEEEKLEQEEDPVLMDETERKEDDVTQTDEEAPRLEPKMVHDEAIEMGESMHDELASDKAMDENLTQDEDGDKAIDEDLSEDVDGDKAMDENLTQDEDGDKAMDEDLSEDVVGDKPMDEDLIQDGDTDKAVNEPSIGVDGTGLDDDADDKAPKNEDLMGTNDGEDDVDDDDDEDDPPPLPVKKSGSGKKRARPTKIKKGEEELCFICFDGGELVVCDRRGCPKVYHPSCVNRDEAFFRAKGKWNCGWHICSECQKPARLMCYTCTYSLCKGCMKKAEFLSIRGNMGFCPSCLSTVTMIERYEGGETDVLPENVNFEDKSSWEFLFRDYWLETKEKNSLTLEEILDAKSQQQTPLTPAAEEKKTSDKQANSDNSAHRAEAEETSSKQKPRKRLKQAKITPSPSSTNKRLKKMRKDKTTLVECSQKRSRTSKRNSSGTHWASEELLDFVAHMRDGDRSMISQFDVQALLLEYIKRKNLRDPRRKSQIICDRMLENLFGKPRVGHFEMLKLLESHFLEASPIQIDDNQGGGLVDPEPDPEPENSEASALGSSSEKKRRGRGKGNRAIQGNLDDYAAIDLHNIGLIYLRRNLMEEIIDSGPEEFEEKVMGSFVRIRMSNSGQQRQDVYRLVQVVGIGTAAEKYKMGKKMTDITLDIVNLNKQEIITVDIISNQDFTEEECNRLRQSIKCNFIPRLTVGEVQDKARVLQTVRVNDWIESEKMRLSHLRDRASDTGRRKELRECVEKLQILNTPEERLRRLREVPEIHADPTMHPDYESAEEVEPEVVKKDQFARRDSFGRRGIEAVSPHKGGSGFAGDNWRGGFSGDSWKGPSRNQNDAFHSLPSPTTPTANRSAHPWSSEKEREREREREKGRERDRERERQREREQERERDREKERNLRSSTSHTQNQPSQTKVSTVDESEKMWRYLDPAGKSQGPFSMAQLRKWNSSGYFPPSLRVWRLTDNQEDSIPLADALSGRFKKEDRNAASPYTTGQHRVRGDEYSRKSDKSLGGNELKSDPVVSFGVTNSVSVSPSFAKTENAHALDRIGSFPAEGTNRVPGGVNQVSYPPAEDTPKQGNIHHKSDSSITILSDPNSISNTVSASLGSAQQMNNNPDWAAAAAAAAMAQQMAAMGPNGAMPWNPQMPVQGNPNTSWGNMVGPTGMNMSMNMGWGAPNFNMGMAMPSPGNANMNYASWGPQAMQPATTGSWGAVMPGTVNPVNQFPTWGMQAPNGGNWGVGPAQVPNVTQKPESWCRTDARE